MKYLKSSMKTREHIQNLIKSKIRNTMNITIKSISVDEKINLTLDEQVCIFSKEYHFWIKNGVENIWIQVNLHFAYSLFLFYYMSKHDNPKDEKVLIFKKHNLFSNKIAIAEQKQENLSPWNNIVRNLIAVIKIDPKRTCISFSISFTFGD